MTTERERELSGFWHDVINGRQPGAAISEDIAWVVWTVLCDPYHKARPFFGLKIKQGRRVRRFHRASVSGYVWFRIKSEGMSKAAAIKAAMKKFHYANERDIRKILASEPKELTSAESFERVHEMAFGKEFSPPLL